MSTHVAPISTATVSSGSAPSSAPGSPRSRVKFLCSHGGKILPRPADGHLKYVGGETRVISVPRDIPFQELMKKLTYMIEGETTLKYQVITEDLDALVSVKSDEDLRHMCDEIERYELAGAPRLRAFLFPVGPIVMETQNITVDHYALEQRYIDAINGIIRLNAVLKQHPNINAVQNGSLVSSGCSSPRSPDSCTTEAINNEATVYCNSRTNMHKVQSSPNICSLNNNNNNNNNVAQHYMQQQQQHQQVASTPHYMNHYNGYQLPLNKPPIDLRNGGGVVGPDRLMSVRSVGRADGGRYQMDLPPQQQYYYNSNNYTRQQNRGNGCCNKCMHYEDLGHYPERRMTGRQSPASSSSPRLSYSGMKVWDNTYVGDV
ncbi:hypothetical protein ABFS83_14G088000 [Erythranthe nasuta]